MQMDLGTLSESDDRLLQAWLAEDPSHRRQFAKWCAAYYNAPVRRQTRSSQARRWPWWAAAALAASVLLSLAWPRLMNDVYVAPGSPVRVTTLGDGSAVTAAPGAAFSFAESAALRSLDLRSGALVLSVRSNPEKPFVVRTSHGTVRVTGTRFGVQTDDAGTQTGLLEGAIELVTSRGETKSVRVGEHYRLTADAMARLAVDPQLFFGWQDGVHSFSGAPVGELLNTLEPFLGKRIIFSGESDKALTVVLRTASLEDDLVDVLEREGYGVTKLAAWWVVH